MEQSKRSTFSILFYLKKKALKKDGTTPIMVRVTVNGEISYLSAKLSIHAELWDQNSGKASGKSVEAQTINQKLEVLKVQLSNKYDAMMHRDSFTTAEKVKNAALGIGVMENSLMKVYKKHNEDLAKIVGVSRSESVYRKHCITYRHIEDFLHLQYNRTDIAFQEITEDFLRELDSYFRLNCGLKPNTVWSYMKSLSKIVNIALNKDIIYKTPFRNFEVKQEQSQRSFLTLSEVETMFKYKLPLPELEIVRDTFIFSCFTGLAYIDVKNLTEQNIQQYIDENKWIVTKRTKTGTPSNVPILEIPMMLINKYKGLLPDGHIFPIPSNADCNTKIKIIAAFCGITKHLHFHAARHTFATVLLTKGVPIESVSSMMGHKHITTTQIYAKITGDKVGKDMDKFSKQLTSLNL